MNATILYKTDFNHTFKSREIIGVFTNKGKMVIEVRKIISKNCFESQEKKRWHLEFLLSKNQTHSLDNFELVLEEVELNKIF